jgi:hypothetical protein
VIKIHRKRDHRNQPEKIKAGPRPRLCLIAMTTHQRINCRACAHFFITWDNKHPYGCRIMGFKGPMLPCITVLRSSGQQCLHFQPKPPKNTASPKKSIIA